MIFSRTRDFIIIPSPDHPVQDPVPIQTEEMFVRRVLTETEHTKISGVMSLRMMMAPK